MTPLKQLFEFHPAAAHGARLADVEPLEDAAQVEVVTTLALDPRIFCNPHVCRRSVLHSMHISAVVIVSKRLYRLDTGSMLPVLQCSCRQLHGFLRTICVCLQTCWAHVLIALPQLKACEHMQPPVRAATHDIGTAHCKSIKLTLFVLQDASLQALHLLPRVACRCPSHASTK